MTGGREGGLFMKEKLSYLFMGDGEGNNRKAPGERELRDEE
jgi:hypothetical protein